MGRSGQSPEGEEGEAGAGEQQQQAAAGGGGGHLAALVLRAQPRAELVVDRRAAGRRRPRCGTGRRRPRRPGAASRGRWSRCRRRAARRSACRARRCARGCRPSWPPGRPRAGHGRWRPCRRRAARSRRAAASGRGAPAGARRRAPRNRPSPVAVPPSAFSPASAWRTASRSVVGPCSSCARWLNATAPTRTVLGTWSRKRSAATRAATSRFGLRSSRLHRARVIGDEHDRRLLDRHRDGLLRLGECDDEHGARECVERERQVPAPARAARGHGGHERGARERLLTGAAAALGRRRTAPRTRRSRAGPAA